MRSATNSGKECKHMTCSSILPKHKGYRISNKEEVSCAETLNVLLFLRRDLRNYFMEEQKQVVYNRKRVRISGVSVKLMNKVFNKIESLSYHRTGYLHLFDVLKDLFLCVFHEYAKHYFDYVNESLDEYIGLLKRRFKEDFGCSEGDVDRIFQTDNVPEDFCSSFNAELLSQEIVKALDGIIFYGRRGSDPAQHANVSYFAPVNAELLNKFCNAKGWDFHELNSLINNLFLGLCQHLAWRVFLGKLFGYSGYGKSAWDACPLRPGCVIEEELTACIEYLKKRILEARKDAVSSTSQKNSLTISQSFAAAPDAKGEDYDLVRESYLEDLELGKPTKSSPCSIEGENSSDIVQQSSDLLGEESEVGLIYSSKNDSIVSTAIVSKKKEALQDSEETEPKFKEVIEGIKKECEALYDYTSPSLETRKDAVSSILQKNSLTISQNFAVAPDIKEEDCDFVKESYLGDLELGKTMKSSPCSINGENSSDIVQQSSDLLGEEGGVGLIYSSENDSIVSTAIVSGKRKALQDSEETEPKFKKVIEGGKKECEALYDYTSSYTNPSCSIDEVLSSKLWFSMNALIRK